LANRFGRRFTGSATAFAMVAILWPASGQTIDFDDAERKTIISMSLDHLGDAPADPSNRFADNRVAAAFGATLFFEPRLSGDGRTSCATCHQQDRQFQDGRPLGRAAGLTDRRTMPLAGASYSPWQFWDGRADSLWAQALSPLEDVREHAGNRTAFVRVIAEHLKDRYERIFGPLPDLTRLPEDAGPLGSEAERAAWAAMPEAKRLEIDRAFANLGKALAAFVASIRHSEARFDRFARTLGNGVSASGDALLSEIELSGLKLFIGRGNCVTCHSGPRFTDDQFHNTGVPQPDGLPPDRGRATGLAKALADPFNCLGYFSDAPQAQCSKLRSASTDDRKLERAFKTPSLRGVATRPPYMHAGQVASLEAVLDHYATAPVPASGVSEIKPLALTVEERAALIAFLKTLD
jgi:cytochrome c peroxidase